jgi:hypothetical protein
VGFQCVFAVSGDLIGENPDLIGRGDCQEWKPQKKPG